MKSDFLEKKSRSCKKSKLKTSLLIQYMTDYRRKLGGIPAPPGGTPFNGLPGTSLKLINYGKSKFFRSPKGKS